MIRMTDIHQHILWGIDDGPRQIGETHAMLRKAREQGVMRIYATPHVCPGFQAFDMEVYRERLNEAQAYSDAHRLGVRLLSGAEIAWTYQATEALRQGKIPTLGGSEYVLIELWEDILWRDVRSAAEELLRAGFVPVFAHVERYRCFRWMPGRAIQLRNELEIEYQVNASTILNPRHITQKYFLERMLGEQAIDVIASDAHGFTGRTIQMKETYDQIKERCDAEYARRLFSFDRD